MGLFPQQFIDDLRMQANILPIVQEYVSLKKNGRTWKGLCPFHSEKTGSFHVDPEKGFFHCFGCNAGGDVFKFLELHEKLAFPEAVRQLAQKVGLAIPETVDGNSDDASRDAGMREALLKVHEIAAAYFQEMLAGAAGARARQQLAEREMPPEAITQLGLGFAPNSRDGLKSRLLAQGFSQATLLSSGLIVQRDNGDVIDRFRNRLMVPISRDTGSVIAFGGRSMDADQVPKYLNSPETPIYSKSRTLYGLNLSKGAIRKVGFAVLVEGYFDFAQVFRTDAAPVVASCGTALTAQQAQLLRRFTTKIVLSFDPDAAGQGAARYRERLRVSRPYLEYLLDQAAAGLNFEHGENRRQFLNKMLAVAARIPDAAARDQFADKIAHKARITEEVVRAEIRKAAVNKKTVVTARELPGGGGGGQLKWAEKGLIWGLFHKTAETRVVLAELEPGDFETLAGREIFETVLDLTSQPVELLPSELLRRLSTMNVQLVTGIAGETTAPVTGPGDLAECARILRRLRCERERAAIQREIDRLQGLGSGTHGDELDLLLNQKRTLAQRIEELTS